MALPASGAISMNDVNVELGNPGTTQISLNDTDVRTLFNIPSGAISLSNGYGCSAAAGATDTVRPAVSGLAMINYCFTSGTYYNQPLAPGNVCSNYSTVNYSQGDVGMLTNSEKAWTHGNQCLNPVAVPVAGGPPTVAVLPYGMCSHRWCFPTKTWDVTNTTYWNGLHFPNGSIHPRIDGVPDVCQAQSYQSDIWYHHASPTDGYHTSRKRVISSNPCYRLVSTIVPGPRTSATVVQNVPPYCVGVGARTKSYVWKMPFATETTSYLGRNPDSALWANNVNPYMESSPGQGLFFDRGTAAHYTFQGDHAYKYTKPQYASDPTIITAIGSHCYATDTLSSVNMPVASTIQCAYFPIAPWCVNAGINSYVRLSNSGGWSGSLTKGYNWGFQAGGKNNPPNELSSAFPTNRVAALAYSTCTWSLCPQSVTGCAVGLQSRNTYAITGDLTNSCKFCFSTETVSLDAVCNWYCQHGSVGSNHGNT